MIRKTLFALILAALVAVPVHAAGPVVIVQGTLANASIVTTSAESVGAPNATFTEHLLTVRVGDRSVLLRFSGEILPDGTVLVSNRDGSTSAVRVGEVVTMRAWFDCARPGGPEPCRLRVVRAR